MNKLFLTFTFACLFSLVSCNSVSNSSTSSNSSSSNNSSTNNNSSIENSSSSTSEAESSSQETKSKAIVIYFSATNHTENVANTIANYTSAPIHKLEPTNPYTSEDLNYSNSNSRVSKEHAITQSGNRVNVELKETTFDEFEEANYIFLGAPVWWQQLSWVVENFLVDNNFSNKTIIPFGTSISSSFNLNNLTPLTIDDENVTYLNPQRFSSNVSSSNVTSWVDSLVLNLK